MATVMPSGSWLRVGNKLGNNLSMSQYCYFCRCCFWSLIPIWPHVPWLWPGSPTAAAAACSRCNWMKSNGLWKLFCLVFSFFFGLSVIDLCVRFYCYVFCEGVPEASMTSVLFGQAKTKNTKRKTKLLNKKKKNKRQQNKNNCWHTMAWWQKK